MDQVRDDKIGVWLDATKNPPEAWMQDYNVVCDYGDGSLVSWQAGWNVKQYIVNYFILPPTPKPLPRCGVCGAEVTVEYLPLAELYKVFCPEKDHHIQVHGATREKALSNYRRQRGEG